MAAYETWGRLHDAVAGPMEHRLKLWQCLCYRADGTTLNMEALPAFNLPKWVASILQYHHQAHGR